MLSGVDFQDESKIWKYSLLFVIWEIIRMQTSPISKERTEITSFFEVESHYFEGEQIKVNDVIAFCLHLMNNMRWIHCKIRSYIILRGFIWSSRSMNVLLFYLFSKNWENNLSVDSSSRRNKFKLTCDLKSLSHNVTMQVLFAANFIVHCSRSGFSLYHHQHYHISSVFPPTPLPPLLL